MSEKLAKKKNTGKKGEWEPYELNKEIVGVIPLSFLNPNWETQEELVYRVEYAGCGHQAQFTHRSLARRVKNKRSGRLCRKCTQNHWVQNQSIPFPAPTWPAPPSSLK